MNLQQTFASMTVADHIALKAKLLAIVKSHGPKPPAGTLEEYALRQYASNHSLTAKLKDVKARDIAETLMLYPDAEICIAEARQDLPVCLVYTGHRNIWFVTGHNDIAQALADADALLRAGFRPSDTPNILVRS